MSTISTWAIKPSISNNSRFEAFIFESMSAPCAWLTDSITLNNIDMPMLLINSVSSKLITMRRTPLARNS